MKILVLHVKQGNLSEPRPKDIIAIPFDKIERIESTIGSENMPCYVNGHFVEESFNYIMGLLHDPTDVYTRHEWMIDKINEIIDHINERERIDDQNKESAKEDRED